MSDDKVFFDTNILVYLYSRDEITKCSIVEELVQSKNIVISTQIINEFINTMHKKRLISYPDLLIAVERLITHFSISIVNVQTIQHGLQLSNRFKYSYFDSLIIASALENKCTILYSEDMHNKHKIENLIIQNPFKPN